ncbi:hypothetical protein QOT17_003349 [Balamuthia mandrillaris]
MKVQPLWIVLAVATVWVAWWLAATVLPMTNHKHALTVHQTRPGKAYLRNAQGLWLAYTHSWLPADPSTAPKGVVYVVHGFADHCGRLLRYSEAEFNEAGYVVLCMDLQGHGGSEGDRGFVEDVDHYIEEYSLFLKEVEESYAPYKDLPRFLSGGSMGGAIAIGLANRMPTYFNGVLLLAPAIIPDPAVASPALIALGRWISYYMPRLSMGHVDPFRSFANIEAAHSFIADPLTYKGPIATRWAAEVMRQMERIQEEAATKMTYPFWVGFGTADNVCSVEGGFYLRDHAVSKDKTLQQYEGGTHDLLSDPNVGKEVLKDMLQWMEQHLAPVSSL